MSIRLHNIDVIYWFTYKKNPNSVNRTHDPQISNDITFTLQSDALPIELCPVPLNQSIVI